MKRRQFVTTSLVAAGTATVAGCFSGDEDGESFPSYETPRYGDWVPAERHGGETGVFFTHVDWETLDGLDDEDDPDEDEDAEELVEEVPILGLPLYGAVLSPFAMFGIMFYPFADDVLPDDGEEVEGVTASAMTWTDDVVVFHGEFDPDVFAADYAEEFDESDEQDGFTLYVGTEGFAEGLAYAVSEETLVVGMQPGEDDDYESADLVSAALDRTLDGTDRVIDADDGRWLYETTGEAAMAYGVWGTDDFSTALEADDEIDAEDDAEPEADPDVDANPVFDDVESLVNTLVFDAEDGEVTEMEARFSALYPADETPSEDDVREHLIGEEEEVPHEVVIEDERVHASATFDDTPS
ncbi:hypothetical protein [Natronococcus occultus]|uniref:Uncharacterized protein n=1 Tax=Natronococcus occultus SP4 TaxID=694430 RepID=L0K3W2_9EURY|nr:hypothetical protein [Natronococcus occultus]AGB39972.1 hypothetical protein Natoc_4280 [Natronococcus occultus SP4]